MKTAVDSNVLIDVLAGSPGAAVAARRVLLTAVAAGPAVLCPVVYSEVYAGIRDPRALSEFLADGELGLESFTEEALQTAGEAWSAYRSRRD